MAESISAPAALKGECTIYRAKEIHDLVAGLLNENDACELDLSGVRTMDTCILQLLIAAKKEAANKEKTFVMKNHPAGVIKMMDLYGLIGFFGDPLRISPSLKKELLLSYGMKKMKGDV